jgi:hypothetical protein
MTTAAGPGPAIKGAAATVWSEPIAIATQRPYQEVYDAINSLALTERVRRGRTRSSARGGVKRRTYEQYLTESGWVWIPTMRVGRGCQVHLR